MTGQVDRAVSTLFPRDGEGATNVKFFLGSNRAVTKEQLAEQLNRADAQVRSGLAKRTTTLDGSLTVQSL